MLDSVGGLWYDALMKFNAAKSTTKRNEVNAFWLRAYTAEPFNALGIEEHLDTLV
jgi:hypothetical protein